MWGLLFVWSVGAQSFLFSPVLLPCFLIVSCVSLSPSVSHSYSFQPLRALSSFVPRLICNRTLVQTLPLCSKCDNIDLPRYSNFYNLCWSLLDTDVSRYDRRPRLYYTSTGARAKFSPLLEQARLADNQDCVIRATVSS